MPKPKLLLRDFLEKHLDENRTQCLRWLDKERRVFMLHWIHANSPSWSPHDAKIFQEWAVFKGRYHQQPDGSWPDPDYTTWKANFRCAVNRNHDIKEVKIPGYNKDKDVKTYLLLPRRGRTLDSEWYCGDGNGTDTDPAEAHSPQQLVPKQEVPCALNTDCYATVAYANETLTQFVPEVVAAMGVSPPSSIDTVTTEATGLNDVFDLYELLQRSNNPDDCVTKLIDLTQMESLPFHPENGNVELPESLSLLTFTTPPQMSDMCIWLRYRDHVVGRQYVSCTRGCRIMNGMESHPPIPEKFEGSKLLGTPAPGMFYTGPKMGQYAESTDQILDAVGNGLHIFCDNSGNVYATRLTSCRVYHADPTLKNAAEPVPLPRQRSVKVFDRETFEGRLREWRDNKGPQPSITILFALGEPWSLTKPINKCHVTVTVVHAFSVFQRGHIKKGKGPDSLAVDDDAEMMCADLHSVSTYN
ncbi:interferon regulatory factor 2-like [Lineus longissimus]|uniref:interferon regulatory factor 2-like n=1 Tax=Lineus longissimus TaxID=88925 RepID=UPI002B4D259E